MEKRMEKTGEEKHEKQKLKDEELDLIAGDAGFNKLRCSACGSFQVTFHDGYKECIDCGRKQ